MSSAPTAFDCHRGHLSHVHPSRSHTRHRHPTPPFRRRLALRRAAAARATNVRTSTPAIFPPSHPHIPRRTEKATGSYQLSRKPQRLSPPRSNDCPRDHLAVQSLGPIQRGRFPRCELPIRTRPSTGTITFRFR